jgi:hypothetical protein
MNDKGEEAFRSAGKQASTFPILICVWRKAAPRGDDDAIAKYTSFKRKGSPLDSTQISFIVVHVLLVEELVKRELSSQETRDVPQSWVVQTRMA